MAKKVDQEELKLRTEAETTLRESLSYLLKQYNLPDDWQPTKIQKEKLIRLLKDHKYLSYLEEVHSILKCA